VQLEAGKRYDIELTYAHASSAGASLKLEWSSPSQPRQVIPTSRLVASKLGAIPTTKPAYTNPATDKNWPDPGILYSDGYYWMTHTTGGPNNGWPLYQSTDLVHWTFVKNLLTSSNRQAFMDDGAFWAPEIHKVNGQYVLTGTARSTLFADRTVIAIATAPEITGPYTVRPTPIVASSTSGTLDSTVFQDWDGRVYLIWKRQSNSGTAANGSIRMQELDPSNLTQFAPGSTEVTLLNNAGGGAWEHGIEEAPEMIHRGSYYYLFYSGSTINTTYAVGVARATSLTGTYTRYPGNVPILQSNATWGGPGHGAFFQDDDGTWWFYYHARHQDNPDFGRVQMLDKVVWSADAWPTFGNGGTPSTTPQTGPRVDTASGSGRYTITGDVGGVAADDVIRVVRNASDPSLLDVLLNGVTKLSVPFAEIETLTLNGGLGNDTLLLDYSRGECVPGRGITYAASSGTDSVQIVGASATDAFHLTTGRLTHGTGAVAYSLASRLVLQIGTFSLDADLNAVPLQAIGADTTVLFNTPVQHLGAVTLTDAAARFAATSGSVLSVSSLTITDAGALDLADNAMVIDYTSTTPFAAVRAMLYTGRAGGTWAGTGIVSSTAAVSPNRGIGYAEATSLGVTSWAGLSVDATAVLLKGAITGDANLDGRLTGDDFALADRGKARNLSSWVAGDFDYDGTVTDADLTLLTRSFAATTAPPAAPAEPVEPVICTVIPVAPDESAETAEPTEPTAPPSPAAPADPALPIIASVPGPAVDPAPSAPAQRPHNKARPTSKHVKHPPKPKRKHKKAPAADQRPLVRHNVFSSVPVHYGFLTDYRFSFAALPRHR
jgi:GH43 family beta-xylosidase